MSEDSPSVSPSPSPSPIRGLPTYGGVCVEPSAPIDDTVAVPPDISPPPYSALPPSSSAASASHNSSSSVGSHGQKLGYVDFVPRVVKKHMFRDHEYEQFDILIQRANDWLLDHDGTRVISCETVTWTGLNRKHIFSDNSLFAKSLEANVATTYMRGLRLWYMTDSVPRANRASHQPIVVHSRTYMPDRRETFDDFVARINENINQKALQGQLVTVETLRHHFCGGKDYHPSVVRPNKTFWKEMPQAEKRIIFFVRLFSVTGQGSNGVPEAIGYKDFVPERNQRNSDNNGYELFTELMDLANRWVTRQQGVRFTNLQSLSVKLKRDESFQQRCVFTEHRCASGRCDLKGPSKATQYLRILRVFFAAPMKTSGGSSSALPSTTPRLTYRTFAPAQISNIVVRDCSGFDDAIHVVNRINQWLKITGARVYGVETISQRLAPGGLGLLGPEATYTRHSLYDSTRVLYLHYVRVYLDGEYIEPAGALASFVTPTTDAFSRL